MLPILLFCLVPGPGFRSDIAALTRRDGQPPAVSEPADQDVTSYTIDLEILPSEEELEGACTVVFTPASAPMQELLLELRSLEVSYVQGPSGPLDFTHQGDTLLVTLASTLQPGDTSQVVVGYSGQPWNEGPGKFGGFWFHPYVSYQMGVGVYTDPPSMGKCFYPCHDHPFDKALHEFHITVPDTLEAIANGSFDGVAFGGGTATWSWSMSQPMSTYLAAVSASDYVDLTDSTYSWIHYHVYPWDVADALGSFQNVDKMMTHLQSLFGPYPWADRFCYVETPKGDMEHAMEVYHLQSLINGQTNNDPILVHEMGHMWWGDCVTESDWQDVWLSEGFATYCEALWAEWYGEAAYDEYMVGQIMIPYLQSGEIFPLGDPVELWGYTTYQKGASVLHMLRHVTGDAAFFGALGDYYDLYAFGSCTTADLQACFEAEYGQDLDWFFQEWVYGWAYPSYDIDVSVTPSGTDWSVQVTVDQLQGTGTFFTMPLEFSIEGAGGDTTVTMWNDMQGDTQVFTVPFEPDHVTFDPFHRVLSTALLGTEPSPPPGGAGLLRASPNPAQGLFQIIWPGMEDADLALSVYDLAGRCILRTRLGAGERAVDLSAAPSGTYLLEAVSGGLRQVTRLTRL